MTNQRDSTSARTQQVAILLLHEHIYSLFSVIVCILLSSVFVAATWIIPFALGPYLAGGFDVKYYVRDRDDVLYVVYSNGYRAKKIARIGEVEPSSWTNPTAVTIEAEYAGPCQQFDWAMIAGWPFACFVASNGLEYVSPWRQIPFIKLPKNVAFPNRIAMPTAIAVARLCVNYVFFFAATWLLVYACRLAKGFRRLATDRCVKCGYSMVSSSRICPECGTDS